jgi:hypothetical protein
MSEFLSTTRGRVTLAVAALVVVLAAGGGYYVWSNSHKPGSTQTASISEQGVCKAIIAQARDYGVLPPDAQKAGEKSVSDTNPNRVTCSAQAQNATFKLIADIPCDDAKDDKCILLQKVVSANGNTLYDTHEI